MHNKGYFYIPSLSSRTIIYKGLLLARQIGSFYKDLSDKDFKSALALIHQRYSTNTFPTWDLAQPFRYLAHNGEINTIMGNRNWMNAREGVLKSDKFKDGLEELFPILTPNCSDSATLDNAFELLISTGKSLTEAMTMLIPQAWNGNELMDEKEKAYYNYHAAIMEPWDGPAAIAFTNGIQLGAMLDRNGLRPSRYTITKDGFVILASETGVLETEPANVEYSGRLEPGKIFMLDLEQGRIIPDEEVKKELFEEYDYEGWLKRNKLTLDKIPQPSYLPKGDEDTLLQRQQAFGYTYEDIKIVLSQMARDGKEPQGSMGDDTPLAVLSKKPQLLYNYFKQLFAQVTNPPIDPIREESIMSLVTIVGQKANLLDNDKKDYTFIQLDTPILSDVDLEKISKINNQSLRAVKIPMLFRSPGTGQDLVEALDLLCERAKDSILEGYNVIILSDRNINKQQAPIPALLATSALQHYLIKNKLRTNVNIILETGEAKEVMHFALLIGYGATAINPYLAYETIDQLAKKELYVGHKSAEVLKENYNKAICHGLLKIISKMGISTIQSYRSAQIFECIGINSDVVEKYFTGTPTRIEGIGLDIIAKETLTRHNIAYNKLRNPIDTLELGGKYNYRRNEEKHMFNPYTITTLQKSVRENDYKLFKNFSKAIDDQAEELCTIRGLLKFKESESISIDEVEPVSEIVKRFVSGAMSFGSLSKEAHETLATAMNTLGGRSNTGEGGEDSKRFKTITMSATKQVASGRFGVTAEYLVNAKEIQIKMAQGAKPGEGGRLPGPKVNEKIGKVRHAIPGIDLISPPPHHDIYSIEDLAQLIYDLKNSNKDARISVKLVSEAGVGTVAAGVAKAGAAVILISGYDGGTGAAPRSSIYNAGLPWELGLAETHQTLIMNGLRSRVRIETDGKLMTGRDVLVAALLGAEEFGFATAPLITMGCVMMRVCNLDTCPVGVATQNPELRKRFKGKPEYVENFMKFIAQELREYMAKLGIRKVDDLIGRTDLLKVKDDENAKAKKVDLSAILDSSFANERKENKYIEKNKYDFELEKTIDEKVFLPKFKKALQSGEKTKISVDVTNINRTLGTILGSEITKKFSDKLEEDTLTVECHGSGGQSFGAFIPKGLTLELVGDSNDYLGKGLSGGKIVVYPPAGSNFKAEDNIIIGNVALYGATSGKAFINGIAGERFCVRNSGATAVVEGVGDHGCEYMTGGRVVVLGPTGKNFAAGMSGGVAYVLDENSDLYLKLNKELVSSEIVSDKYDVLELKEMIEEHVAATGSKRGKEILDNFSEYLPKFKKIISYDYSKMLQLIAKMEEHGLGYEQAQIEAFYAHKKQA